MLRRPSRRYLTCRDPPLLLGSALGQSPGRAKGFGVATVTIYEGWAVASVPSVTARKGRPYPHKMIVEITRIQGPKPRPPKWIQIDQPGGPGSL